jgi:4-coumarate--CoA ligase (photoactive yellow protein activation family)
MTSPLLSRCALARVLQSLLTAELYKARFFPLGPWPEHLVMGDMGDGEAESLGCDSLEMLALAAATNEMFCLYEASLDAAVFRARTFGDWLDTVEAAWQAGVTHLTFRTSGSTGIPRRCTHQFGMLKTEVRFLAEMFATNRRVFALAPAHHIYGFLFTAMLADRLGAEVVTYDPVAGQGCSPRMQPNDLLVSIPERWSFLNRTVTSWPRKVDGVVSTAPCARELIGALITNGLDSMTEIYGSTETAGIGTRRWPEDRYRLMPQWTPTGSVDVDSADADGTELVHLSGARVQPMDRLLLEEDRGFTIAGRLDGAVQVGGTNVYPARIAALLAARPGVAEAYVGLARIGERLRAFIVPDAGASSELMRRELEVWIEQNLTAVERPKSLVFGPVLPEDWRVIQ